MANRTYPSNCSQCSRSINPGELATEILRSRAAETYKDSRVGVDCTGLNTKRILVCYNCTRTWIIGFLDSERLLVEEGDRNWYDFVREDVTRD